MMPVSATGNSSTTYAQLSSGKRINSAADDASGLAIAEKLQAQQNGYDTGSDNAADMQNLLQTAEGGLSTIEDSLQRMRELAVQASNGTLSDSDRANLQHEVDALKGTIEEAVSGTEYNNMKLLDGSYQNKNTASSPDGTGQQVSIESSALETLGIADFDVTGEFDLEAIDSALEAVSSARSELGAASNRMDYTITSNDITSLNLAASRSRIEDTNYAKSITNMEKDRVMQEYQMFAMKEEQEQMQRKIAPLMGM